MSYIALFKVEIYEWNTTESKGNTTTIHGIIYAESYTKAAAIIEDYYGDSIVSLKIELLEDTILTLPKDKFKEVEAILKGGEENA